MPSKPHEQDMLSKLTGAHIAGERAKGIAFYQRWLDRARFYQTSDPLALEMDRAFGREYPNEHAAFHGREPPQPWLDRPAVGPLPNSPEDLGMHSRVEPGTGHLFDETDVQDPNLRKVANEAAEAMKGRRKWNSASHSHRP